MHVLITGASGFIGGHLIRALHAAGHEVSGCTRSPETFRLRHPWARAVVADFSRDLSPEDWLPRLQGVDAVINAAGIIRETHRHRFAEVHTHGPIALFNACARAGVHCVVQISALGAAEDAPAAFLRSKALADAHLAGLEIPSTILRPSLVHGPGAESAALFKALALLPVVPLVDGGGQLVQPIHVEDLVRAVLACLDQRGTHREVMDAVGPEPMPFRDLLASYRRWLGKGEMRTLTLRTPLVARLARLAGPLGSPAVSAETVAMLARGSAADAGPFVARFGFRPRSLEDALNAAPSWEADRRHARLYVLRTPLRWSIGALWVVTGLLSAGIYPVDQSYALLEGVGLSGAPATAALYGAALLDVALGVATLARWRLGPVAGAQILLMLGFSAVIAFFLPEHLLHPFGPVTKNLPLLVATLVMLALEEKR